MSHLSLDSLENGTISNYQKENGLSKNDQRNLKGRFSKLKPQSFYLEQKGFTNLSSGKWTLKFNFSAL